MKVKNIMFFGFAAAILSAGAASAAVAPNPSEKNIVTSKYYVDNLVSTETNDMATQTWVGDQGFLTQHQDISGKEDKNNKSTSGLITSAQDGSISAVGAGTDNAYASTSALSSDFTAIKTAIETAQNAGTAAVDALDSATVGGDGNVIMSVTQTNGAVTATAGKIVNANVDDNAAISQSKIDGLTGALASKQGLLGGGAAGTVLTNSGTAGTVNATVVSSSIDTSVNTDDNNIPTVGAVEGLVSSATNGNVIPERTGDCALNSGKNCALVAEADGLHWRVMAGN